MSPPTAVARNSGLQVESGGDSLRGGGPDYEVRFDTLGMHYVPALGSNCTSTQHLSLRPTFVGRGQTALDLGRVSPAPHDRRADYERAPGVHEHYDVRVDGVQLSWSFAKPLPGRGDLVVRYAVDTTLPAPSSVDGALAFVGEHGGVHIGAVHGIDANGRTIAGSLRWHVGELELSLPASFVDDAAFPLVLDPLVGTTIPIASGLTNAEGNADSCAMDGYNGGGRFLVVWERTISATSRAIRGQLLRYDGTLDGATIFFGSSGTASSPRVSCVYTAAKFGVVWRQTSGGTHSVLFQTYSMQSSGGLGALTTIASSTTTPFPSAVIGGDVFAATNSGRGFTVVYEDPAAASIRRRVVSFATAGQQVSAPASIWVNTVAGTTYSSPAIARHALVNDQLLVVAREQNPAGPSTIVARVLDTAGGGYGASQVVSTSATGSYARPAADGYGGHWIVAWESQANHEVLAAPVTMPFAVGSVVTVAGSTLSQVSGPTVSWASTRAWIGYRHVASATGVVTLRLAAVNADTCVACNDTFNVSSQAGLRIVASRVWLLPDVLGPGGLVGARALGVFDAVNSDVNGQLLTDEGTQGAVTLVGTSCGAAGNQATISTPTIGRTYTEMRGLTGFGFFNLGPVVPTMSCGGCEVVPLSSTITGENAPFVRIHFDIPCTPGLVGQQFLGQWIVYDPAASAAPCPGLPGYSFSERHLLTIGQ